MKNKIIVSLLLILLVAISVSAASASEDIADAIAETSESSDIELINEDTGNTEAICEDPSEDAANEEDVNLCDEEAAIDEEENAIVENANADNKKLGEGNSAQDNNLNALNPENEVSLGESGTLKNTHLTGKDIRVEAVDKSAGDPPIQFSVKLTDDNETALAGKYVYFMVGPNEYSAKTDSNGIATLKIYLPNDKLTDNEGIYDICSNFRISGAYNESNLLDNVIFITKKSSFLTVKNLTYKSTATKKLTATFKDKNNNFVKNRDVTFTVNGKKYTATTNSKGVATAKIKLSKKGKYTYTVKFAGDSTYKAVTKKGKLTIKAVAPTLTLKKYDFKESAKTKKIKVTLKRGKTALKKQKISLKVNGKTYTAKTNSKGVATVKIKLNKAGTFKYTVKYAGNGTYKAAKKTNKVIIK